MLSLNLPEILATASQIARRAGAQLAAGRALGVRIEHKGVMDLVTEHDRAAEALIVSALQEAYPEHAVVAEEGSALSDPSGAVWYVDPLDGTTNFAHGHPIYAVSMALVVHGEPVVGVVFAPEMAWEFTAAAGHGAYLNGTRLAVSATAELDSSLLATGFPYDRRTNPDNNLAEFSALMKRCHGVRRLGSAALDLAVVARGAYDGYWEYKLKAWDIAAGALLVREAGGTISDLDGSPFSPTAGRILASNGLLHEPLRLALHQARQDLPHVSLPATCSSP